MSRQVFPVFFLLLFLCFWLCGEGWAAQSMKSPDNKNENTFAGFFKSDNDKINNALKEAGEGQSNGVTGIQIESVFLAAANSVVVALAEVDYSVRNEKRFALVEKFIETENEKWREDVIKSAGKGEDWKTQLVTKSNKTIKEKGKVKSSAVVANGNKIYYFSINNSQFNEAAQVSAQTEKWHITVAVGEVEKEGQKTIKWDLWGSDKLPKAEDLNEKINIDPDKISLAVGFGFVIKKKIVFAVQGEAKEQTTNKYVTVFFKLDDQKLEKFHVEPTGNCYPSLFLLEGQIVMVPSACTTGGNNQMIKVVDIEDEFKVMEVASKRLQKVLKNKKRFIATQIDTTEPNGLTDVLLFTQQTEKHEVCLWVTDGIRAAKVDTIITGDKDNFDLSILHTSNELFVLHNNYGAVSSGSSNDKSTYNLKRLPDQLNKIKLILNAWKITDDKIKDFFNDTTAPTSSFTNRLVGFLSNNSQDNQQWKDEYFYENATVTNGTRDSGGFKFSGAEAGAKWLVGKLKKEDQPYNFTDLGFTLVATVKIDNDTNEKFNSILGVGLGGNNDNKTIGLWCSKGVWGVGDVKDAAEAAKVATETCVQGEKYQVVLIMEGKKILVYIDGKRVEGLQKNPIVVQQQPLSITHFYFGVNDAKQNTQPTIESHVTVTNVLLYNRYFEEKDINNLKECPKTSKVIKNPEENLGTNTQGNEQQPTPPPNTSGDEKEEVNGTSPSRTEDGGVGGGVRVFSLLLAVLCAVLPLLCVSAPLLHL